MRDGNRTIIREPDRTIIREGDRTIIRHNESSRFAIDARNVRTERRGANTETIVERGNGIRIVSIADAEGRLLRRVRRDQSGDTFQRSTHADRATHESRLRCVSADTRASRIRCSAGLIECRRGAVAVFAWFAAGIEPARKS